MERPAPYQAIVGRLGGECQWPQGGIVGKIGKFRGRRDGENDPLRDRWGG